MSLFSRLMLLYASVLVAGTALLLFAPVTVSVPVRLSEAVGLLVGLVIMLVANAALLRVGLAPLQRLMHLMGEVDLLHPAGGQPRPAPPPRPAPAGRTGGPPRGCIARSRR